VAGGKSTRPVSGLGRTAEAFERFSNTVELPLTVLALLWLPVLVLPYVLTLSPAMNDTFAAIDYFVWAAFAVEYVTKLYLVPDRRRFFTHNLVDLAVVALPMFRPLRALRLLRLGRVGVVLANSLQRARELATHRNVHFVLLAVAAMVFGCAALVLDFEQHAKGSTIHNYGQALWWAIVTVTTVGYGDTYPVTAAGRGVAVVLMLVGIGLIGVLTATVASYFVGQTADRERAELVERLDRLEQMVGELLERTPGQRSEV
jgi:voltage-gated potassium channel